MLGQYGLVCLQGGQEVRPVWADVCLGWTRGQASVGWCVSRMDKRLGQCGLMCVQDGQDVRPVWAGLCLGWTRGQASVGWCVSRVDKRLGQCWLVCVQDCQEVRPVWADVYMYIVMMCSWSEPFNQYHGLVGVVLTMDYTQTKVWLKSSKLVNTMAL